MTTSIRSRTSPVRPEQTPGHRELSEEPSPPTAEGRSPINTATLLLGQRWPRHPCPSLRGPVQDLPQSLRHQRPDVRGHNEPAPRTALSRDDPEPSGLRSYVWCQQRDAWKPALRYGGLRNLGLATEDLQNKGISNYNSTIPTISSTQTVNPALQSEINSQNATNAAAPDPGRAASYAQGMFDKYLNMMENEQLSPREEPATHPRIITTWRTELRGRFLICPLPRVIRRSQCITCKKS